MRFDSKQWRFLRKDPATGTLEWDPHSIGQGRELQRTKRERSTATSVFENGEVYSHGRTRRTLLSVYKLRRMNEEKHKSKVAELRSSVFDEVQGSASFLDGLDESYKDEVLEALKRAEKMEAEIIGSNGSGDDDDECVANSVTSSCGSENMEDVHHGDGEGDIVEDGYGNGNAEESLLMGHRMEVLKEYGIQGSEDGREHTSTNMNHRGVPESPSTPGMSDVHEGRPLIALPPPPLLQRQHEQQQQQYHQQLRQFVDNAITRKTRASEPLLTLIDTTYLPSSRTLSPSYRDKRSPLPSVLGDRNHIIFPPIATKGGRRNSDVVSMRSSRRRNSTRNARFGSLFKSVHKPSTDSKGSASAEDEDPFESVMDDLRDILDKQTINFGAEMPTFRSLHPDFKIRETLDIPPELRADGFEESEEYADYKRRLLDTERYFFKSDDKKDDEKDNGDEESRRSKWQKLVKLRTGQYGRWYLSPREYAVMGELVNGQTSLYDESGDDDDDDDDDDDNDDGYTMHDKSGQSDSSGEGRSFDISRWTGLFNDSLMDDSLDSTDNDSFTESETEVGKREEMKASERERRLGKQMLRSKLPRIQTLSALHTGGALKFGTTDIRMSLEESVQDRELRDLKRQLAEKEKRLAGLQGARLFKGMLKLRAEEPPSWLNSVPADNKAEDPFEEEQPLKDLLIPSALRRHIF